MNFQKGIIAGLLFGLFFSLFHFSWEGLAIGMISGLAFGIGSVYFVNSGFFRKETAVSSDKLLSDEKIFSSYPANLIIRPKDFKLKNFAFDSLFKYIGMKDREALGGMIHLSNYRLIFKTHRYNRIRGEFSIFLPSVNNLRPFTFLFVNKLILETAGSKTEIVIDSPNKIAAEINSYKNELSETGIERLRQLMSESPEKCIDSTEAWALANRINNILLLKNKAEDLGSVCKSPLDALASYFYNEFMDRTLLDEIQKKTE